MLGVPFRVRATAMMELRAPGEDPAAYVERLAREKAEATAVLEPNQWVLGGDTTVVIDGDILEKPQGEEDAVEMLMRLSGRTHQVLTGLALVAPGVATQSCVDQCEVRFRPFAADLATAYVSTGEPMDKAGAYGIQGKGAALVEAVNGDFFTVMGLSVSGLMDLFYDAGYPFSFGTREGASPFAS